MPHLTRRHLIASAVALSLAPLAASADTMLSYTPGLAAERLAAGDTVFLDFAADWCSTCRAQGRAIADLRASNPEFDANITFIRVDWDQYGRSELAFDLNIPRRSTLVLLRGEEELGRIVAGTHREDIEALLSLGLAQS